MVLVVLIQWSIEWHISSNTIAMLLHIEIRVARSKELIICGEVPIKKKAAAPLTPGMFVATVHFLWRICYICTLLPFSGSMLVVLGIFSLDRNW